MSNFLKFTDLWFDKEKNGKFTLLRKRWEQVLGTVTNSKAGHKLSDTLLAALREGNEQVRVSAASALRNATQFPEVVPALLAALKDESEGVRGRAASTLRDIAQHSRCKYYNTLSRELLESLLLPGLDANKVFVVADGLPAWYSASDYLFDALMAVAEYPKVM